MEDQRMEAEEDIGPPGHQHVVLENEPPLTGLLEQYGWYILIIVIAVVYLYSKLSSKFSKGRSPWNRSTDYSTYDSEEIFRRQEAMDAARRRLQEKHEAMAQKYLEEQKKKEEEKRKQKIEEWNNHLEGKGYRSKVRVEEPQSQPAAGKKKNVYRTADYNPLAGGGGVSGFRPPRRNASRGG